MKNTLSPNKDGYLLSRTSDEYQRLHRQALVWEKVTSHVLFEAGLEEGMDFLDVGCGTGDVMQLAGEMVTTLGSVTGFDIDEKIGLEGLEILEDLNTSNYSFDRFDIANEEVIGQFDFVYTRFLLIHMTDPLNIIRKLYNAVRPGGILLIQDYDFAGIKVNEKLESTAGYMRKLMLDVFSKSGKDPEMGTNLSKYFIDAGIGSPTGTDASSVVTPLFVAAAMMKSAIAGFRESLLQLGIATEQELEQYNNHLDQVIAEQEVYYCTWPMLNSAWIKKGVAL